jgi:hypothetical protein
VNSTAHPGNYEVLKQALAVVLANIVNYEKTPVRYACYLFICTYMYMYFCVLQCTILKIIYIVIFDLILYCLSSLFECQFNEQNSTVRDREFYLIFQYLSVFVW